MKVSVRALDRSSGQAVSLELDALDLEDAQAQLRQRQLVPLSLRASTGGGLAGLLRPRPQRFDVELFVQELHAMVGAGLNLMESLEAISARDMGPEARAVLARLGHAVQAGQRLSQAMRLQDAVFPPLFIGLVEAAESTGDLGAALERYSRYAQRMQTVRQKVISAAIYPSVLLGVGGAVGVFLLGWVVPRFAAVYRDSQRELPWASRLLLSWGDLVAAHWPWVVCILLIAGASGLLWLRSHREQGWSTLFGRIPAIARWLELLTLSRLYLTLSLLLRGGLPVARALVLAQSVLPLSRRSALAEVGTHIAEGRPLSAALQEAGLNTAIALRFVRAGERSGQLAEMLGKAAEYHEGEATRWVDRFTRAFEPVLMAGIGVLVGGVVLLLYMPIFELAGTLG